MKVGTKIKEVREERGMTQKELALAIPITEACLCRYEQNERLPKLDILIKISDIFKLPIDYFLGRAYNENKTNLEDKQLTRDELMAKLLTTIFKLERNEDLIDTRKYAELLILRNKIV